ncbi:MAG: hypothetical protein JNL09_04485 [Anaerolineales bacterium]|nr:hypothetical protein [Anaerolineales bacterium]
MSLSQLIETGFALLTVGVAIGLWFLANRHAEPRDLMLLLGASLSHTAHSERDE